MKKHGLYLLVSLFLCVFMLAGSNCVNINIPKSEGPQSIERKQVPVINIFSASPAGISAGDSSTLSWQVTDADTVNISPDIGNVALSGSTAVSPTTGTAYVLTATNSAGSVTAVTQVSVETTSTPPSVPAATLPVIDSFAASPASILVGGSSTLSWAVSNVISVTISPGIGSVSPTGSTSVSPASTTTYTLTATNAAGWRSKSITITALKIKPMQPIAPVLLLAQFEDKTWVLDQYGESNNLQNVISGKEVNAKFDSTTGKVSGSAGCNSYSASYTRSANKVAVSGMTSTMMLCTMPSGIMQQESAFKSALSAAESCKIVSNKLQISCAGDRLLIFHPK